MSKLPDSISDVIECPICSCYFDEPKSLPCLHTFCLNCIDKYCSTNQNDSHACPICRQIFKLPEGGCDNLPTNFFVKKLITSALKNVNILKSAELNCAVCLNSGSEIKATSFCIECEIALCDSCVDVHRKDKHAYVLPQTAARDETCTVHDKAYELYCETCEELSCVACSVNKHRMHELREIDDEYSRVSSKMDCTLSILNDICDKYDEMDGVMEVEYKNIKESIEKRTSELKEKIEADSKELLRCLDIHRNSNTFINDKTYAYEQRRSVMDLINSRNKLDVIIASKNIEDFKNSIDVNVLNLSKELSQIVFKKSDVNTKGNIVGQIYPKKDKIKEFKETKVDKTNRIPVQKKNHTLNNLKSVAKESKKKKVPTATLR